MLNQKTFQNTERELMNMKFGNLTERKVLQFWREYEPKRVDALLLKGTLRKALVEKAAALWDMQMALEETENLDPMLAKMEAWNRLMKIEEDEKEEAEAWGMTLEEYRNRPSA